MERKIFLLAGLGDGDESKGSIVDWLTRNYPVKSIWRYNGGAQASHHVVLDEGIMHCFSQIGSGSLVRPVTTYLTNFTAINPISLRAEYEELQTKIKFPLLEIYLDEQALIITPYHVLINQMREISRGTKRFGSCGRGVGEAISDSERYQEKVLRASDFKDMAEFRYKLRILQVLKIDQGEQLLDLDPENAELLIRLEKMRSEKHFQDLVDWYLDFPRWSGVRIVTKREVSMLLIEDESDIVFEGAQGPLLDRDYGFYPHITKSNTRFDNAEKLIQEYKLTGDIIKIGVLRAYATRHGAGPFLSYDASLTTLIPEQHNTTNDWQGDFRIGWFDLLTTRYALKMVGKIRGIALTNLDRLLDLDEVKVCVAYKYQGSANFSKVSQFFDYRLDKINSRVAIVITDIKLPPSDKLKNYIWRQQITNILNNCQPIYQTLPVDKINFIADYIKYLEKELGENVHLISTGPSASDKKIVKPLI
jgi:adenylosuccinate synthase